MDMEVLRSIGFGLACVSIGLILSTIKILGLDKYIKAKVDASGSKKKIVMAADVMLTIALITSIWLAITI